MRWSEGEDIELSREQSLSVRRLIHELDYLYDDFTVDNYPDEGRVVINIDGEIVNNVDYDE